MTLDQETVNETHWRHRIGADTDIAGIEFHHCRCGKFFDTAEEADAHWWRAVRALQRSKDRRES
jgi:hypothetical protein